MYITAVTGGSSLSGTPIVTAINTTTKTLTISSVQTFTDNHVLKFEAWGSNAIQKATGISLDFSNWNSNVDTMTLAAQFKKTVEAIPYSGSSPAWKVIGVNNTYGISGGNHVRIKGLNVDNSSSNRIGN